MHIVFTHGSYPAQFGPVAKWLCESYGHTCTVIAVSNTPDFETMDGPVKVIGVADPRINMSKIYDICEFSADTVLSSILVKAVTERLLAAKITPDVIINSTLKTPAIRLRATFDCPIISYVEQYRDIATPPAAYRKGMSTIEDKQLAEQCNLLVLSDIVNSDAFVYTTDFGVGTLLPCLKKRGTCIPDGCDTVFWSKNADYTAYLAEALPPLKEKIEGDVQLITYAVRALEGAKGFDTFMAACKRVCDNMPDVHVVCVGADRKLYDTELKDNVSIKSFKSAVLSADEYDPKRITFVEELSPEAMRALFNASSCHVYLTVPITTGWSLSEAMACEAPILASDCGATPEIMKHSKTGYLANMLDAEELAKGITAILAGGKKITTMRKAARRTIVNDYDIANTAAAYDTLIKKVTGGSDVVV